MLILLGLLVLVSAAYVRLWRRHRRDKGNMRLLFDAVENADYTLRFTEGGKRNNSVNHWLNRIKEVLQRARDEQMERERYFEMVLNATDTGLMVVDERDNILLHNQAAMQLLHTDILTHMSQIPAQRLTDERLARHETTTTLRGKRVRIVALSNVEGELDNREVDVAGSGRKVNEEIVQFSPHRVTNKLLERVTCHAASPKCGLIRVDKETDG